MKKLLIIALATSAAVCSSAQEAGPTDAGRLDRGSAMLADGNYTGSLDQLDAIHMHNLSDAQRQQADWIRAEATYHLRGALAVDTFRHFLDRWPASQLRELAQKRVGDCLYLVSYPEALKEYLKVDPARLTARERNELNYRTGYCYLRLAEFAEADKRFKAVKESSSFHNASTFYEGYIQYALGNFNEAEKIFQGVKTSRQPGCMADYYLSQIAYSKGDYALALSKARDLLRRNDVEPQFTAEANRIAGEALYQTGSPSEAVPYLQKYVATTDSPATSALYILGVSEYLKGEYARAIQHLEPVTDSDTPAAQSAYLYIGQAMLKEGNTDGALLAFDKAAHMDFDREVAASAFYNYAVASTRGGRIPFGNSVATFEEFLRLYPESPHAADVQEYIVIGYLTDNDYERALKAIDGIDQPSERVAQARRQILYTLGARKLAAGDANAAYMLLSRADQSPTKDADLAIQTKLALGEAAYRTGKYDEAENALDAFLRGARRQDPNLTVGYYDMGYTLMGKRDYTRAADYFNRALEAKSQPAPRVKADIYNRLADIAYYDSDFKGAAKLYAKAYEADPTSGDYAIFQQAVMKGYDRQYKEKIADLGRLCELFPTSALVPEAMTECAQAYIQLGDYDKAIDAYRKLIDAYPAAAQSRTAYLQLAQTQSNAKHTDDAIESYCEVIRRYPTGEEAAVAAQALKHIHADRGTLDQYIAFIEGVENAPGIDVAEIESLTFESAEKIFVTTGDLVAVDRYIDKYPDGSYGAKAMGYMMEGTSNDDDAAEWARRLIEKYPDNSAANGALVMLAQYEYDHGRSQEALNYWLQLEPKASNPAMANTARLGILRSARDTGDYDKVISAADAMIASTTAGTENKHEAIFSRGLALANKGQNKAARESWQSISNDTDDLYGAKSAFYLAEDLYDNGLMNQALGAAESLTASGTPHTYWLARGFILLSDIYASQDKPFEAREYLKALRDNYPGKESDIFMMIDSRLNK